MKTQENIDSKYLVYVRTTKSAAIKSLIERLQSLFNEVNFVFMPTTEDDDGNKKTGGLMIKEINKFRTLLVFTKLEAEMFESFNYNSDKEYINIGINLSYMSKCLKCMANYDSLTMAIEKEEQDSLILSLENAKDKKVIRLNLMELQFKPFNVDPVPASYMINMVSSDFHKYCKDLDIVSDKMEIMCNGKKLKMSGKGEIGDVEYQVLPSENGLTIVRDSNEEEDIIVEGIFDLKYLTIFSKCSSFSNQFTIFLKNNYPLILQYNVDGLGEIKFVLSQSKANDTNNSSW